MQQKRKFRSPFIKKTENGNTLTLSTPIPPESPLSKHFQFITELPLCKFIEVAVDENYAALIISGIPDIGVLHNAWYEIYQQYLDAMGDSNQLLVLKLYREITRLTVQQEQIQSCIEVLSKFKSVDKLKKFEDHLNSMLNCRFQFKEKRADDLLRAGRIARQLSFKIDIKQKQLDNILASAPKDGVKISREYFQSVLITLSDYSKYPVMDSITTYEFCERVKRFTAFVQAQKQKK
jgi:hypothetical protein